MTLIEVTNGESKTYLMTLNGSKECNFRISQHVDPHPVRFFLNTSDQKESVCTGNCTCLPVCRKCGLYSSQLPVTVAAVPMSSRKNGIN